MVLTNHVLMPTTTMEGVSGVEQTITHHREKVASLK